MLRFDYRFVAKKVKSYGNWTRLLTRRLFFSHKKFRTESVTELSKWSECGDEKTRSHHDGASSIQTATFAERHTFLGVLSVFSLFFWVWKELTLFQNVSELVSPRKQLLWSSPRKHSPVSLGVVVSNTRIITPPMALRSGFWKVSRCFRLLRVCFSESPCLN